MVTHWHQDEQTIPLDCAPCRQGCLSHRGSGSSQPRRAPGLCAGPQPRRGGTPLRSREPQLAAEEERTTPGGRGGKDHTWRPARRGGAGRRGGARACVWGREAKPSPKAQARRRRPGPAGGRAARRLRFAARHPAPGQAADTEPTAPLPSHFSADFFPKSANVFVCFYKNTCKSALISEGTS